MTTRQQMSEELKATPLAVKFFAGLFGFTVVLSIGWATYVTNKIDALLESTNAVNIAMIKTVENLSELKTDSAKHEQWLQMAFADISAIKASQSTLSAHVEHLVADNVIIKSKVFK